MYVIAFFFCGQSRKISNQNTTNQPLTIDN